MQTNVHTAKVDSGWKRREDGCRIYIVIKQRGGFLLLNRENRSQFTGIINLNKKCYCLESSPSNKTSANTLNRLWARAR